MRACLLVLAAGAAVRMRGDDKTLQSVAGVPVLRALCLRGLAAGLKVRVTVPHLRHPRARALADLPVTCIAVPKHRCGMAASLRAGVDQLSAASVLILPADMPEITTQDLRKMARHPGAIVQATTQSGAPGHPVRFAARYFSALRHVSGDRGARQVVQRHASDVARLSLPGCHARIDLDTPEAWAAWRKTRAVFPRTCQ